MATETHFICDRCGKEEKDRFLTRLRWTSFYVWEWNREKHLCDVCMKGFNEFMENGLK